jgi:hypothetical protein
MRPLKRHAALLEPFDVGRLALMRGVDRRRLHAVEQEEEKIGSGVHRRFKSG